VARLAAIAGSAGGVAFAGRAGYLATAAEPNICPSGRSLQITSSAMSRTSCFLIPP
jgi:hypothetical protein